jgi:hypothetical protein
MIIQNTTGMYHSNINIKTGSLQELPFEKYRFEQWNTCIQLPTAIQERELKPFMGMACVRPPPIVVTC